ncbi:hypothetical protein [Oricola sp.]|uniref:hypothetical protein n=1 Tax=Oricola sp. TaxID=1979950 RepID=UPI0025E52385|nr:hypothetical protein [Oricola sp.]MCI5078565.1 hypothetical protein [Oricola sp.]
MRLLGRSITVLAMTGLAVAANSTAGLSAEDDPQARSLELIKLSRTLYERALERSDPILMLAAARLRMDADAEPGKVGRTEPSGSDLAPRNGPNASGDGQVFSSEQWLQLAVRLSNGSSIIAGLADDIRSMKPKGLEEGGIYTEATIAARGKRYHYDLNFVGGAFAEIYSEGLGPADIDMFVYDNNGALVCSQTDPSNVNQCGWTPGATGPFDVTLENKSDFADTYALMTN